MLQRKNFAKVNFCKCPYLNRDLDKGHSIKP